MLKRRQDEGSPGRQLFALNEKARRRSACRSSPYIAGEEYERLRWNLLKTLVVWTLNLQPRAELLCGVHDECSLEFRNHL